VTLIADLTDFTHLVTRIKVVPAAADDVSLTPDERQRGADLAGRLGMRALSRAWQILFKGYEEVTKAGNAVQAAEMVLIRLAYAADLPSPDELIERLQNVAAPSAGGGNLAPPPRGVGGATAWSSPPASRAPDPSVTPPPPRPPAPTASLRSAPLAQIASAAVVQPVPEPPSQPVATPQPVAPRNYAELVALAGEKRDLLVKHALEASLKSIAFADGRIEVALASGADPGIIQMLSARLKLWTGRNWMVSVSNTAPAAPTIREVRQQREEAAKAEAGEDPLVRAILEAFPGATVKVRLEEPAPPPPPALSDAELEAQLETAVDYDADLMPDDLEEDD